MKILFVVGSTREGSYNQIVANYLINKYKDSYDIKQVKIKDIPLFSENIENQILLEKDKARECVLWADGVVIVSPENNYSVSAVLKNFIDWCSRGERVFAGKPVMITGASTGHWGTIRAQGHLRQILRSNGVKAVVVPEIEVYFPEIQKSVKEGKLMEEKAGALEKGFKTLINYIETNK